MPSQFNEDGIIADLFAKIGMQSKRFVEFGCGSGNENNTIELLKRGWSGIWCEPNIKRFNSAKALWKGWPVVVKRKKITPRNVNLLVTEPLDFLSIDIDGEDRQVWGAVRARPRVVCIECWPEGGSTLGQMTKLAISKGYYLHGCGDYEVNAFFVRNEETQHA